MNEIESSTYAQKKNKNYIKSDSTWSDQVLLRNRRKGSQVSISSVSSNQSDSSNSEYVTKFERKASLQEIIEKTAEEKSLPVQCKRTRSNSDGTGLRLINQDPDFQVFPSLPDFVLEKLGLRGNGPRERLSEEELEQKFTSLALAFTIDATTIKDRCDRQRRSRDQTELNLTKEIEKFKEKLSFMQPLCTDYEKAELFSNLMTQIDVIMNATCLVSISAEKYGSVQHEERLTESVDLMVNHVQVLKQQRDSARKQLQHSKRVLQNSPDSSSPSPVPSPKSAFPNKKILTQRRASFNNVSQSVAESSNKSFSDTKKITRRTSDLSPRASSLLRNVRPSRLELGVDLVKIKEGFVDQQLPVVEKSSEIESENEFNFSNADGVFSLEKKKSCIDSSKLSLRYKLQERFLRAKVSIEERCKRWTEEGNFHETCRFCALICFSLGFITLANIYIEFKLAKRGL
ncbi:unnamed protein product [Phaedon cochleariae]|uniref:Lymphoid-restricted membrane protein-like n=1 Tax=Phaedon cochleariae TaxID=80249 RepID=A0A9P0GSL9_PHACE|nr:unnamed protein product [Phaedon cochleariae]